MVGLDDSTCFFLLIAFSVSLRRLVFLAILLLQIARQPGTQARNFVTLLLPSSSSCSGSRWPRRPVLTLVLPRHAARGSRVVPVAKVDGKVEVENGVP